MALYLHLLGSPAGTDTSSSSADTFPTWINEVSNGMWQTVITGPVLKAGRVLCPWMPKLMMMMPEDWWVQKLLYRITKSWVVVSSRAHVLGLSLFPSLSSRIAVPHSSSSLFANLFVFLFLQASSPIFFTQSFTDFHFPNLFYSSVIDSLPAPGFSFAQTKRSCSLLISSASPNSSPHSVKYHFLFGSTTISVFSLPSSS